MKSLSTLGIVLLLLAVLLFYLTTDFDVEQLKLSHLMGIMGGVGLGLIIGGIVGYVSKGSSIKAEQKRKEWQRLQQEKIEIEQQAADLAQQNVSPNPNNSENSNL